MKKITKLLKLSDRSLLIEDRVFIIACSAAILASLLSFVANLFLDVDWRINIVSVLIVIVYSFVLVTLLKGKATKKTRVYFILAGLCIFSPVWFLNAGSQGSISVYFIFLMSIGMLTLDLKDHKWFGIGITALFLGLYAVEKSFPHLVIPYHNPVAREQDIIVTVLIALIIVGLILHFFKMSYDEERKELFESRKRLEESTQVLIEAKQGAEAATAAKTKFLANISHEIRTPLNGIVGSTQLLMHSNLSPSQEQLVQTLESSCNLLLNIIEDVLDISKIEAEKMTLVESRFNLHQAIKDVLDITSPKINLLSKHLSLDYTIDETVIANVIGDENRIKQVLVNLVGNAIKFTEKGSIHLSVTAKEEKNDIQLITFTVVDTGIGIKEEDFPKLFKPFTQLHHPSMKNPSGTGLGLTISKKLAEMMSGYINLTSKEGKGSTFSFTIPLKIDHSTEALIIKEEYADTNLPLKILLVEDNVVNQMVALKMFETLGYHADVAVSGVAALKMIQNKDYDLVFMDIQMPIYDGFETTRRVLQLYTNKQAPVIIAMTANAMKEDERACFSAGMKDFLTKPFTIPQLHAIIQRWSTGRQPHYQKENAIT